jgi:hypothetical protein
MNPEQQRKLVLEHLERRERIAQQTREQLEEREKEVAVDPLAGVPEEVRRAAEDEYYESQGKKRYTTSDGRTMFLSPAEIAQRRRARSGRETDKPRFYGLRVDDPQRNYVNLAFNAAAVVLALLVVYVILH